MNNCLDPRERIPRWVPLDLNVTSEWAPLRVALFHDARNMVDCYQGDVSESPARSAACSKTKIERGGHAWRVMDSDERTVP